MTLLILESGSSDGLGTFSTFSNPIAMTVDNRNNYLYISDYGNNYVRGCSTISSEVKTIAMNLETPFGIALDEIQNYLYVASYNQHTIFKIPMKNSAAFPIDIASNSINSEFLFAGFPGN